MNEQELNEQELNENTTVNLDIDWRRKSDTVFEAYVNEEYAGFVAKHGSWKGCVFLEPFVKFSRTPMKYEYNHGAGKTKDDLIKWVTDTINTKSYLLDKTQISSSQKSGV